MMAICWKVSFIRQRPPECPGPAYCRFPFGCVRGIVCVDVLPDVGARAYACAKQYLEVLDAE